MTTRDASISDMVGKTFVSVEGGGNGNILRFNMSDGSYYEFYHSQDCCENVSIEDINGDLQDLVGVPLLKAEEVDGVREKLDQYDESYTWTFYLFATIKGYVNVRWYGTSNGYYSESVSLRYVG